MSSWRKGVIPEKASRTVTPRAIFSPESGGRQNTSTVSVDIIMQGKTMLYLERKVSDWTPRIMRSTYIYYVCCTKYGRVLCYDCYGTLSNSHVIQCLSPDVQCDWNCGERPIGAARVVLKKMETIKPLLHGFLGRYWKHSDGIFSRVTGRSVAFCPIINNSHIPPTLVRTALP